MLKRCLSPLTLVNQLALIVLLSTALGVTGMAISGWLVQGVQGNAHAINEAGSLRMQSYRLRIARRVMAAATLAETWRRSGRSTFATSSGLGYSRPAS